MFYPLSKGGEELLKVVSKGSDNQKLVDTLCIEPLMIPPNVTGPKNLFYADSKMSKSC